MNGDSIPQWLQCCNNTPRSFVLPISPDGWLYPDFISAENTPMLVHFVSCIPILFPNSCNDLYSSHYYIHTHIVIIYIYYLYISYMLYRSIMFHLPFLMKPRYRPVQLLQVTRAISSPSPSNVVPFAATRRRRVAPAVDHRRNWPRCHGRMVTWTSNGIHGNLTTWHRQVAV